MISLTPTVRILLIVNVVIFVLQGITQNFWPELMLFPVGSDFFKPFQLVTYMFLHGGWEHLLSNMLGLFVFGPLLEYRALGPQRFLTLYFVTGIGGGMFYLLTTIPEVSGLFNTPETAAMFAQIPTLGASGAILGLTAAFGLIFPNLEMGLFLIPFPVKAKYLVTLYAVVELYSGVMRANSGVAHFAHIGGMVFAFLLLKYWKIRRIY